MIFTRNMPTTDKSLSEELVTDGWLKIKEPKNLLTAISASVPFMFLNVVLPILISLQFYKHFISTLERSVLVIQFL